VKTISFNELRRIKDRLPNGSMQIIATALDISLETVRNYFGGTDYEKGEIVGIHTEKGPDGGIVLLDDTTILELAMKILKENNLN
jgi:hypothetical protein